MRVIFRKHGVDGTGDPLEQLADIRFEECSNINIDENLVKLIEEFGRFLREVGPKLPDDSVIIRVDGLLCEIRKMPEGV